MELLARLLIIALVVDYKANACDTKLACCDDNDCDGDGNVCVTSTDGYYAQCVDCTDTVEFQNDCSFWSADILATAEAECDLTCGDDVECDATVVDCCTDDDCSGSLSCAVQSDNTYAQCINCDADDFQNSCTFWSDDLLTAAESTCNETCGSSGDDSVCDTSKLACCTDDDCSGSLTCVVQSDNTYAQCISCDETDFQNSCTFWSDDLLTAAESTCGETCKSSFLT